MTPNQDHIQQYLSTLFAAHEWTPEECLMFRGVGEKGTDREGIFSSDTPCQPALQDAAKMIGPISAKWADLSIATFIVPAILNGSRADEAGVKLLPAIVLDMDAVPGMNAYLWLEENIGRPSMTVLSGGRNEWGPKRHFYYVLEKPGDPATVAALSDKLAHVCGGDSIFKRMTQPVRLPGSVHGKKRLLSMVEMFGCNDDRWGLEELEEKIGEASPAYYLDFPEVVAARGKPTASATRGTGLAFRGFSPYSGMTAEDVLHHEVREGGADGFSRWDAFSMVAGYYISHARRGEMSVKDSQAALHGWVLAKMVPPWPAERVNAEWDRLMRKDVREHGPMPVAEAYRSMSEQFAEVLLGPEATQAKADPEPSTDRDEEMPPAVVTPSADAGIPATPPAVRSPLRDFAAVHWIVEPAPITEWLVEGLIAKGEQHMFAAEGGSGKSYAMLDLGMRIAAHGHLPIASTSLFSPESSRDDAGLPDCNDWLGKRILRGGTVVLFLNEDSRTTLHQRALKLAGHERALLRAAGERFIPLPMPALKGAFTFCDGNLGQPTAQWTGAIADLLQIEDLALVVWDTFSTMLHGSEADSTVVNQMMRQANKVCGDMGAASLFLHHVRKDGRNDTPINSPMDMKSAIRGSSAIIGAMRLVIGMWRAPDWKRRAKALKVKSSPDEVWKMAVVKTNLDDVAMDERTIIRKDFRLVDVTASDPYASSNTMARIAWLVLAVEKAAKAGHPFSSGSKADSNGLYQRRYQLPEELAKLGRERLAETMGRALEMGKIVLAAAKGGPGKKWLDVKGGKIASDESGADLCKGAWDGEDWTAWTYDEGQEKCQLLGERRVEEWLKLED